MKRRRISLGRLTVCLSLSLPLIIQILLGTSRPRVDPQKSSSRRKPKSRAAHVDWQIRDRTTKRERLRGKLQKRASRARARLRSEVADAQKQAAWKTKIKNDAIEGYIAAQPIKPAPRPPSNWCTMYTHSIHPVYKYPVPEVKNVVVMGEGGQGVVARVSLVLQQDGVVVVAARKQTKPPRLRGVKRPATRGRWREPGKARKKSTRPVVGNLSGAAAAEALHTKARERLVSSIAVHTEAEALRHLHGASHVRQLLFEYRPLVFVGGSTEDQQLFLEWMDGGCFGNCSHDQLVDRFGFTKPHLLKRAARDICTGLLQIHASGLAHNDMKPANILIDSDSTFKIADLGSATPLSLPRLCPATPATHGYAAPERKKVSSKVAGKEYRPRSVGTPEAWDSFSLGVCLLCLLVRQGGMHRFVVREMKTTMSAWDTWCLCADASRSAACQPFDEELRAQVTRWTAHGLEPLRKLIFALLSRDHAKRPRARDCLEALE
jgi:serine/threonine protein kinase